MHTRSWTAGLRWPFAPVCLLVTLASCFAFAQSRCAVTIPIVVAPDEEHGGVTKTPHNFEIRVDGAAVTPMPAKGSPQRVALLLDVSSSMRSHLPVPLVAETVRKLQASDEVTFVAFGTREILSIGPTTDRSMLLSSIYSADVPKDPKLNRTAMRDAVAKILQGKKNYDAIVVFTDGGDSASKTKEDTLKKLIEGSDVRIFAFLFLDPVFDSPETAGGRNAVQQLVNLSGGIAFLPGEWHLHRSGNPPRLDQASERRVAASLELLTHAIDSPTVISISWPEGLRPKGSNPFKIQLTDERGKKISGDLVAYPRRTPRCAAAQAGGAATPANPN